MRLFALFHLLGTLRWSYREHHLTITALNFHIAHFFLDCKCEAQQPLTGSIITAIRRRSLTHSRNLLDSLCPAVLSLQASKCRVNILQCWGGVCVCMFGWRSFYREVFLQVWKSFSMKGIFTNLPLLFALGHMEIRVLFLLLTLQSPDTFLCTFYAPSMPGSHSSYEAFWAIYLPVKGIPSRMIPFSCAMPLGMYQVHKFFLFLYSHMYAYSSVHTVVHYYKLSGSLWLFDLKYSLGHKAALDHATDNGWFSVCWPSGLQLS